MDVGEIEFYHRRGVDIWCDGDYNLGCGVVAVGNGLGDEIDGGEHIFSVGICESAFVVLFYGIDHKLTHVGEAVHLCGRIVCGIERGGIVGELVFLEEFRAFVFLNEEYVGRRVDFVVVGYGRCCSLYTPRAHETPEPFVRRLFL